MPIQSTHLTISTPICPLCTRVVTPSNESAQPFSGSTVRMHRDCAEYMEASQDHLDRVTRPGALTEIVDAYRETIRQAERSLAIADCLRCGLGDEWHYIATERALSLVHRIQVHDRALVRSAREYPLYHDDDDQEAA